ncbi:MAG: HEAT repeat domain-containing protein [bacterium]
MKWIFRKKDPAAKLVSFLSLWHIFETVNLNQPELEHKLRDFTMQIEQHINEWKALVTSRAASGKPEDISFIFDLLSRLPSPPTKLGILPSDPKFSWENAELGLGPVARVGRDIRVAVQRRLVAGYEKESSRGRTEEKELVQQELRTRLSEIDQEYRNYLLKLLKLYEFYDHCLNALAEVKSPIAKEDIINRLRSPSPPERLIALKALLRSNWQPQTVEQALNFYLVRLKMSENESEQKSAAKAIEKIIFSVNDARQLKEVVETCLAEEGATALQAQTLIRLAEINPQTALERFQELLRAGDEPSELKIAALEATKEKILPILPGSAVELLLMALDDLEVETRVRATTALARLPEKTPPEARTRARERLIFALRDGDLEVREAAAEAINPKTYPDASVHLATTLLAETNPNGREFAARALARNFPAQSETTAALLKALNDEDAAVRKAAAEALAAQRAIPNEPTLRLHFLCARQDWQSIVKAGKSALPCLLARLRDQREEIRLAVVKTLGKIGAQESVKELCITLSDSSREVRKAAANALSEIGDPQALPALESAIKREGFAEVRTAMERAIRQLS